MHNRPRASSNQSSTATEETSMSSPVPSSTFDSPASLHSSPTFSSIESFNFKGTTNSHHMSTLPQFSVANMQNMMKPQAPSRTMQSRKTARPWMVRRALSQTMLDMEAELNSNGIEALGLGLFEPRPRETIVSRQCAQGNVVLDGIMEVMQAGR